MSNPHLLLAAVREWRHAEKRHAMITLGELTGNVDEAKEIAERKLHEVRIAADRVEAPTKPSPLDKEYLKLVAKLVKERLPDNHGFIVLAAPFGSGDQHRLTYISDMNRVDAINLLKEFMIKAGASEDWMKHLP